MIPNDKRKALLMDYVGTIFVKDVVAVFNQFEKDMVRNVKSADMIVRSFNVPCNVETRSELRPVIENLLKTIDYIFQDEDNQSICQTEKTSEMPKVRSTDSRR